MKRIFLASLAFFMVSVSLLSQSVGINETGANPDASAILDVSSTTKGFLPPRMTDSERDGINNPAAGLIIYNITDNRLEFYNGTNWIMTSGPCKGEPVVFTFNGLEYRPIVSNGVCWLDRNLGATQVATSSTDADSYGDLYQWGRAADGHQLRNSPIYSANVSASSGVANFDNDPSNPWYGEFVLRNQSGISVQSWFDASLNSSGGNDLWQSDGFGNDPCPDGYRVPTRAEWNTERSSWNTNNAAGAFGSPLKLPMAGSRARQNGNLEDVGTRGRYWSTTATGSNTSLYEWLWFRTSGIGANAGFEDSGRAFGRSVRCRKN